MHAAAAFKREDQTSPADPSAAGMVALKELQEGVHLVKAESAADLGACAGFVLSLLAHASQKGAVVWVSQHYVFDEGGSLYGPGLHAFSIVPHNILYVTVPSYVDVFWSLEEALKSQPVKAVVGEFYTKSPLDLTLTRRLSLRSQRAQTPVYLMSITSAAFPTAAQTHWSVTTPQREARSKPARTVGPPVWSLELTKNKNGPCGPLQAGFNTLTKRHFDPRRPSLSPFAKAPKPQEKLARVETGADMMAKLSAKISARGLQR